MSSSPATSEPAVAKLQEQGVLPESGSAEDLGRFAKAEYARYQKIVQGVDAVSHSVK